MSMDENRSYYQRRLSEERARAKTASDAATARVHRDLAKAYEGLLDRLPRTRLGVAFADA